jgi:hypothetical protein
VIKAMENPMFQNLIDATWKLIEHEKNTWSSKNSKLFKGTLKRRRKF